MHCGGLNRFERNVISALYSMSRLQFWLLDSPGFNAWACTATNNQVFDLKGANTTLEKCNQACLMLSKCALWSGVFGQWSQFTLQNAHTHNAVAYSKVDLSRMEISVDGKHNSVFAASILSRILKITLMQSQHSSNRMLLSRVRSSASSSN